MKTRTVLLWTVLTAVSAGRLAGSAAPSAFQEKAREESEKAKEQEKEKRSGIVALPVLFYTPETKLAFGGGGTASACVSSSTPSSGCTSAWTSGAARERRVSISRPPKRSDCAFRAPRP